MSTVELKISSNEEFFQNQPQYSEENRDMWAAHTLSNDVTYFRLVHGEDGVLPYTGGVNQMLMEEDDVFPSVR